MPEALELTLLLADGDPQRYERAAVAGYVRFLHETKNVDLRESLAVLASSPATALAELLGRRPSCERVTEALVRWSRA